MLRGARLLNQNEWGPGLSYQVIARKYRPQSFEDLVGQNHVAKTLHNGIKAGRIPHGILFNGPRGTGKTSSARIVAKTLLCENPSDFSPCQICASCKDIVEGRHLDLIEIDGASNNGVDSVRELRETVGYRPSSGKYKIYLIDEVHMLSTSAFNALLKTLEEPPDHVIFMFATTEVQKIPATILSRCQRFDLKLLGLSEIKGQMIKICDQEKVPWDDGALWTLAKQAKGSLRDGLTLLDQVLSFGNQALTEKTVREVLGLSDRAYLFKILTSIAEQNKADLFSTVQNILKTGNDPQLFLEDFLEVLRNLMIFQMAGKEALEKTLPVHEMEDLGSLSPKFKSPEIQLLFDVTLAHLRDLRYAHDPNLAFEMLLYKIFFLPRIVSGEQMQPLVTTPLQSQKNEPTQYQPPSKDNLQPMSRGGGAHNTSEPMGESSTSHSSGSTQPETKAVENQAQPTAKNLLPIVAPKSQSTNSKQHDREDSPSKPTTRPVTSTEAPQSISIPSGERTTWEAFVQGVKSSNGFLGALLEHTSIFKEDSETITLGLPQKMVFLLDKLQEPKNIERTEKFLKSLWADNRKIDILLLGNKDANENPSPKKKHERSVAKKKAKESEAVENHPLVQQTKKIFKGNITQILNEPGGPQ